MTLLSRFASVLRWLIQRDRAERDLQDELDSFVDMAAAERMRNGTAPDNARRLAVQDLGGLEQAKERVRSGRHGAWLDEVRQDLHYGLRQIRRNPTFSSVAIATLALGIGVNTAIFGLWHGVLYAQLPGVDRPEGLVMLTDPGAAGLWRGRDSGTRRWLSYSEFEQLRDHADGFSALMATQSSLNRWQVRIDGGGPEEANGRLVSGGFFEVLGVHPAVGRLFTPAEDRGEPAYAVISHAYWQRRFNGHPDVIGETLIIRDTAISIVGVTPPGFVGETAGQQPDLWLLVRLQPRVLPGSDWLHEQPPDKVMWLHVFGRLNPGVTNAQAEARANATFLAGLESFYGAARRDEALNQQLRVRPAARGASASRGEISSSLTMLLTSAGVLLLIACANLANLLVGRGSARQAEIAVRSALGASRHRVIRQLATENLMLAAMGGLTAIAAAYVVHGALVSVLQEVEPRFFIAFALHPPVLAFLTAATVAVALVFGALPAWQVTRSDPGAPLKDHSRGAIGSARGLRAGRLVVGLQLALTLPLLVGAGLLLQTVYNLQHPELGFDAEKVLVARVNLGQLVQDVARRDRAFRELQARIQRIPGVEAASFSQLGLFSGRNSTATIEVSGNPPPLTTPSRDSALDRVGAGYFTTLRIPIMRGRDIQESDRADSQKVCIVNEAFVRRHFGRQDPLGMYVTTVDDGVRASYQVVGLVRDARTQSIRDDVEPRLFVPADQRPTQGISRTFLIRTRGEPNGVIAATRESINGLDAALSTSDVEVVSIDDQISPLIADDRTIARLAVVFATLALTLAAIGLYGVLSYSVSRRSSEIAIRIALGARPTSIVLMVLRRTAELVVAGLLVGSVLAYVVSRMIVSRLYGVGPQDPLNLTLATGVLVLVAFIASYVPARRASRIDPMAALHRG